jgi:hypothetical protein
MPERRKRRTLRRRARHDAVAALDLTRGIDRRRARRRRDVRYARAMNTYRTCSKHRRRHRARRRRRGAPSVTSRRVFFSTAPRALRVAIASKPSAAAAGAAPARRHARPSAPRASSDRSEPPDARACRAARTVARLAFRGSAGDFDVHPDERRASFAGARGVSFLPSNHRRPIDRSLTPSRPTSRKPADGGPHLG